MDMASRDYDALMDFAAGLAERAGAVTLEHFGRAAVEWKGDGSEVTLADRAAEELIRAALAERFPDDGIVGEEGDAVPGRSGRRWIVDPIDGTRSFASGVPLYGVLIALEEEGRPTLGCCHLPALRQTVVAADGAGAWLNGQRTNVSEVDDLSEARLMTAGLEYWRDWATDAGRAGLGELIRRTRFARTWCDCYGYILVATGRAELLADVATGQYWDYAPMLPILREAGGRFTSLTGSPAGAWTSALVSNGRVHEAAAACWRPHGASDDDFQGEPVRRRRG